MQYLMVLMVMAGVVLIMVAAIFGTSYLLGAAMRSGVAPADAAEADPCAQCQADRDWYEDLPMWKRNLALAWWLANRFACAAKGCR